MDERTTLTDDEILDRREAADDAERSTTTRTTRTATTDTTDVRQRRRPTDADGTDVASS